MKSLSVDFECACFCIMKIDCMHGNLLMSLSCCCVLVVKLIVYTFMHSIPCGKVDYGNLSISICLPVCLLFFFVLVYSLCSKVNNVYLCFCFKIDCSHFFNLEKLILYICACYCFIVDYVYICDMSFFFDLKKKINFSTFVLVL